MTINELIGQGVMLRCVTEVIEITEPNDSHPYGQEIILWKPPQPQDLNKPLEWDWAQREIVSIWPIHDTHYPLLQIEVR